MTEKNESNRRRKWAPKARTGCRTCKTRHVKCDEQKPVCRRCVLSGFRCDGYPVIPNKRENGSGSGSSNGNGSPPSDAQSPDSPPSEGSGTLAIITRSNTPTVTSIESPSTSTCTAVTPLRLTPTEPYVNSERETLSFFINVTASMVGRSRAGPIFWKKFVPQAAWSYSSVRHALLASAISSESLVRRDWNDTQRKSSELQVLSHTSKAVQSLLTETVPLDVVLLTSATLGILDLFNGQWDTACTHVTSGAKLAKQARQDPKNEPFISFYCEAFASALPHVLKDAQDGKIAHPVEENSVVRLHEAVRSLNLAVVSFDKVLPRLSEYQGVNRDRMIMLVNTAKAETEWILPRWDKLLQVEKQNSSLDGKESMVNLHRIESPFSAVMADLNDYLDQGGPFDMAKFEVTLERTMPFYTLAKAGPNLKMRQVAVQLMKIGAELRGKRAMMPADSPTIPQKVIEIFNEDEG